MPGALDRVNRSFAASRARPRAQAGALGLDEYASWFTYGGVGYPMLQTTMSTLDQERIAWSTDWAAKRSGPVSALVMARMQVFSQIRFQWTRFSGALPGDLFGTGELRVLERPWPGGTTADLLKRMEWDVSAAGNAYVRRKGANLHRLFPAWVIIVMGSQEDAENPSMAADVTIAGFLWVPPGGKPMFFTPQQVAHYAPVPDPDARFLGMSWITPVMRDLQSDQAATEHKFRFFENSATPNLVIRFDPAVSVDAVRDFKALLETEHRGVAKAFRTLYLGGGADAKTVGMTFRDMDYAVIQGRAESRLAANAGVPPSWVGFSEGLQGSALNAGNFNSARRRFSDGTMADLWGHAASSLQPLLAAPDPGASLWYDARIPFMREDAKDLAAVQAQEASTIAALIRDGYEPDAVIKAVRNNDWGVLIGKHSGLTSVQLQPPSSGAEPMPGFQPAAPAGPAAANGNGARR